MSDTVQEPGRPINLDRIAPMVQEYFSGFQLSNVKKVYRVPTYQQQQMTGVVEGFEGGESVTCDLIEYGQYVFAWDAKSQQLAVGWADEVWPDG